MIESVEIYDGYNDLSFEPLYLGMGGDLDGRNPYYLKNIDGIGPVKADIYTTTPALSDGVEVVSSRTGARNLVLTIGINKFNAGHDSPQTSRRFLNRWLMPTQYVRIHITSDDVAPVMIYGTVESNEPVIFSREPEIKISIICPKSPFLQLGAKIFTGAMGTDFVIDYDGDVASGIEFEFTALTNAAPIQIRTLHPWTYETISAMYYSFATLAGGKLSISTIPKEKHITVTDLEGNASSGLRGLTRESVWTSLTGLGRDAGRNHLMVTGGAVGNPFTMKYVTKYGGL